MSDELGLIVPPKLAISDGFPYTALNYYDQSRGYSLGNRTNFSLTAHNIYGAAIRFPVGQSFDRFGTYLNGAAAAGKLMRLMLYNVDPVTGKPGTLYLDGGELAADATGLVVATVSLVWPATVLWGAIVSDGAPQPHAYNPTNRNFTGFSAADIGSYDIVQGFSAVQAYGAAPATFPASTPDLNLTRFVFRAV